MQRNETPAPARARPAASVVLLRDGRRGLEILYLRRSHELSFHPGAWVFPGGRIDPDDERVGDLAGLSVAEAAARRAAVREAAEEAALEVDARSLLHACHWTTPEGAPKRFATWFFIGRAPAGDVQVDGGEIIEHCWATPDEVLQRRDAGDWEIAVPSFVLTTRLLGTGTVDRALAEVAQWSKDVLLPRIHRHPEGRVALYEPDAGYRSGDLELPGKRHRMWMLSSGWTYERDF